MAHNGRCRVVITNVRPQVDGGKYPAKAAVGENLIISADIFADGHDLLTAYLFIKNEQEKKWQQHPMQPKGNDYWTYIFKPEKTGKYQFAIYSWIDHFTTWQKGLSKKIADGQDVAVDVQAGVKLFVEAIERAGKKEQTAQTKSWQTLLTNKDQDIEDQIAVLLSSDLHDFMMRHADRSLATKSAAVYTIDVERKKAAYSTWYELFPRSASPEPGKHGTFKDVKKLLPRITAMGFDVLYMPPIHPIGTEKRKGKNNSLHALPDDPGSPWAIGNATGGHKAIHPQLGTLKDFKDLVAAANNNGIEIAMDIAFQCAPDHPYVKQHPEWFKWRPDGTVQYAENPPKKYEDILPINFETAEYEQLWDELKSIFDYWIDKGVRIFRVDNPHTKAFPFWEWVIPAIRKNNPDVIFLAEAFTRPRLMERLAKAGFNQSYTYFTWRNTKYELETYMKELTRTSSRYYFRPNFWPNTPDILPPLLTEGGENAHIMRLILAATLSSNYGLYGPVYEFGLNTPMPGKEEYVDNEKYEIRHWNWDQYTRIKEFITRINKIRKENPALQSTWNISFLETTNEQIICYKKEDKASGNTLIIVVNLDVFNTQSAQIRVPAKMLNIAPGSSYTVYDLLSREHYRWKDEWNFVQLNPYEIPAHILIIERP